MKKLYKYIIVFNAIFLCTIATATSSQSIYAGRSFRNMTDNALKRLEESRKKLEESNKELIEFCRKNLCSFRNDIGKYYIEKNVNGEYLILDDGSIYKVYDDLISSLWNEFDEVIVTDDGNQIINLETRESVEVIQIE